MGMMPRDIHLGRDQVAEWIETWKHVKTGKTLRQFIGEKLAAEGYADTVVDTSGHESLSDKTPLLDMVMMDMESYGVSDSDAS